MGLFNNTILENTDIDLFTLDEEVNEDIEFIDGMNESYAIDIANELASFNKEYTALMTEAYMKECDIIFSENYSFDNLYALHEAIGGSLSRLVKKIIENITKIVNTFLEKLSAYARNHSAYMNKYKDYFNPTKYPFKGGEVKAEGPIFHGIDRCINYANVAKIPALDLATMGPVLTDNDTFFTRNIMNTMPINRGNDHTARISGFLVGKDNIADWCKKYFGYKDGQEHVYSAADITNKLAIIREFLLKYQTYYNGVKTDKDTIIKNVKQYERTIQANTNESVYSLVLERTVYFNELDIANKQTAPQQGQTNQAGNAQNAKTNNNANTNATTQQPVNKDAVANDVKAAGGENDQLKKQVQVYLSTATQVLTAKLTAIEWLYNEAFVLARYHVTSYVGRQKPVGGTKANAQPAAQPQAQPAAQPAT